MPLPTPIGRQKEVLYLPAEGHTVVLGTAGSGKTTLAILRSAYLSASSTDHGGRTLLLTFTRSLAAYLRYLEDNALGDVVVENYHKFGRGYLASRGKMKWNDICAPDEMRMLVDKAVKEVAKEYDPHSFFHKPVALFVDELRWMAQHGVNTLLEYQEADRAGRRNLRVPKGKLREIIFKIRCVYRHLRTAAGKRYDWDDLAGAVRDELIADPRPRRYKHIVIDEGQDLSPQVIRSLVSAVPPDGSITFFGDVAQQIFGHQISWRTAGLAVRKIWEFKENYRNTKQIAGLALAIARMSYFEGTPDIVEPAFPSADGPRPAVLSFKSKAEEIAFVVDQAVRSSSTLSVGVFFRDRADEAEVSRLFPKGSLRLHRDMPQWCGGAGIRYGTYHSAKGLEFDMVILPFCGRDRLPDPDDVVTYGQDEAEIEDGRLLYVGVTRARTRLIITHTGVITGLLPPVPDLYDYVTP